MELLVANCEQMHFLASKILSVLEPGDILGLTGDLGVGKTEFVRGGLRDICGDVQVQSPSYILELEYPVVKQALLERGLEKVVHFDFYRLSGKLEETGLEDFQNRSGELLLVEWPEKVEGVTDLLSHHIKIEFAGSFAEQSFTDGQQATQFSRVELERKVFLERGFSSSNKDSFSLV